MAAGVPIVISDCQGRPGHAGIIMNRSTNDNSIILQSEHSLEENKLSPEDTNQILQVLGLSLDGIATINRQQLAQMVDKSYLSLHQKTLVWEIRRKNKNRLAAAKCRKRKLEDITHNSTNKEELQNKFMV